MYSISGYYGDAQRWLYYALLLLSLLLRHHEWIARMAATCMTYGGGATIHAILLAAFGPVRGPDIPAMEFAPLYYHPREVTEIYDPDIDAAFAVTVTGCLFILPLGMWSKVFRRTRRRLRLILWSFLILLYVACNKGLAFGNLSIRKSASVAVKLVGKSYLLEALVDWTLLMAPGTKQFGHCSGVWMSPPLSPNDRHQPVYILALVLRVH